MTNLLYVRQQERNRLRKDVIKPLMTKTLYLWFLRDLFSAHSDRRKTDHQHGRIQLLYWNKRRHRASERRRPRFGAKRQRVKLSETLSKSRLTSVTWRTFTWNTTICPTAQFKMRTTYLHIPVGFYDLCQHVVKTCPFCNSMKPRPERSRVSGLRAEEFGDLIFLDHGSAKIEDKASDFWLFWMELHLIWQLINVRVLFYQK